MISDTIAKKERGDCMKKIEVICSFCGAIKSYSPKSGVPKENKHSITCSGYFQSLIEKELGTKAKERFTSTFRHAKERCCNPKSKDYDRYKGKWNFVDYVEFHKDNYDSFKAIWLSEENKRVISIDRINGNLPYQPKNVRWVTMKENLQNKPNVKPVFAINILTGETLHSKSLGSLVSENQKIFRSLSAIHSCLKNESIYKNTWKINYE